MIYWWNGYSRAEKKMVIYGSSAYSWLCMKIYGYNKMVKWNSLLSFRVSMPVFIYVVPWKSILLFDLVPSLTFLSFFSLCRSHILIYENVLSFGIEECLAIHLCKIPLSYNPFMCVISNRIIRIPKLLR